MRLTELLVSELDLEAEYTRKHLERVPMERLDFKAHDKSSPLGMIASFVAILPTWGGAVLMSDAYDVAPEGVPVQEPKVMETRRELLETFDANIGDVRTALQSISEASLMENWSLKASGNAVFTQQRYLVFRTFFLNHLVHHRAQLGVYLRLLGEAVPAVYNDSADEKGGMFMESATEAALT